MLNSILCRYMQRCTDRHISFHADIRSGTTDFIADNDLTSLFCNLPDNAIAAAGIIPDSFIEINTSKLTPTASLGEISPFGRSFCFSRCCPSMNYPKSTRKNCNPRNFARTAFWWSLHFGNCVFAIFLYNGSAWRRYVSMALPGTPGQQQSRIYSFWTPKR